MRGAEHWYRCDALTARAGIALRIMSADRKAVRIAKSYLGFITKARPGRRGDQDGGKEAARVRGEAEQVGTGIPVGRHGFIGAA
jgi:hypothetical protein